MKNKSIWTEGIENKIIPSLKKNIKCDILIIGGGIAGLSTAYHLKDSNQKVVLIDRNTCGSGATSNNTGKITFMQDLIYNKIQKNYNSKVAKLYLESQKEAITLVETIVRENNISCHLTKTNAYVFSNNLNDEKDFNKEIEFYKNNNIKYKVLSNLPIKYPSKYAIETEDSYVFNPYEYVIGLKNILKDKIDIYENTRCIEVNKKENLYTVKTSSNYTITSKYVVISSHYPMFIIPFFIPFKTRVERFFIGASKSKEHKDIQILSHNEPSISMRYYQKEKDSYLLYGRRSHSITRNLDVREDFLELKEEYQKHFNKDLEYFYHTHDLMTYDSLPFIGKVDENLYIETGFNKWGNTNGTIAGKIISDMINNKENKYAGIFNPKRGISLDKIKNLSIYNIDIGSRYIAGKIKSSKEYYDDNVKIEIIDGKKCGIYIDDKGKKHVVSNICPHMKCNLIFNYIDKTWDCPCHASRFDIDGNIIYGPAVYDIKIDK
ncbi:MAG: FAD-dependent oxidoreductase, partial [Bacilli bacterium]